MRRLNSMNLQQFNNIRVPDTRIKILGCKNESRKTLGAQVITRMPNFHKLRPSTSVKGLVSSIVMRIR